MLTAKRPRVVVVGATGQLGADLVEAFEGSGRWDVLGLGHDALELARPESVRQVFEGLRADVVINSAAFNRVDACESEVERAFAVNAVGALEVARAAERAGALCVYVSTDYVFDGERPPSPGGGSPAPYTEDDRPNPINVYGASKLAGEVLTAQGARRWLVVRVASLFGRRGARGKGGNFVTAILGKARTGEPLRVVADVVMSPTYTRDAAAAIERLVDDGVTGTVHVVNGGACSWYEFARAIVRMAGLDVAVEPVPAAAYPAAARRPAFSVLDNRRARSLVGEGLLRPWQEALADYLPKLLAAPG